MADLWRAVEEITALPSGTFRAISVEFRKSPDYLDLSSATQKDYDNCHKAVCERVTKSGAMLGDLPLDAWTPGAVRRYRDARAEESKSRAAHDIRYIKRVFQWAVSYDLAKTNPAKEIKLKGLAAARDHYVQDEDYQALLNLAPWRIAVAAHLAYLTGRRRRDILGLTKANIQPEGLLLQEGKTGKVSLIEWSEELRETVRMMEDDYAFFHYSASGFDSAWQRLRKALREAGFVPFQFKDLRAKHASDLDESGGDATENLQHSGQQVTRRHYLRKAKKVVSLR